MTCFMSLHQYTRSMNILKSKKTIQIVLLITGVMMITYGVFRGEVDVVLNKAIKICLECVGIG